MNYRKNAVFFTACLIFCLHTALWAADSQDSYGSFADYLNDIYGIDDNAGLTAFPILNIPMGGRSEGMASAFTAVSDDISFIEYNPAGSSMLEKSEFAFFHNNWIADSKIEGIAYASRFGDLGIAAGAKWLYTPFTEYNNYAQRVSNGYFSEGAAILNASYNLLSGYYFGGLSVGISLKGAFRIMPDYTADDDVIIGGSGMSQSAVMGMADVGILTRFNFLKSYSSREKNTAVALVIKNLGPPVLGEPLPTAAVAAVSYKPLRPLTLAFDFYYPLNMVDFDLSEKPYFAFGTAVNVTKFLSMRAGAMVKAGGSRITVGSAVNMEKIAVDVNYTLDLLTQLQPLNRISLGVRLDLGDDGRQKRADTVNELYILGLDAFSQGKYSDARNCWQEALRLDPKFEPAQEGLDMLNSRQDLQERVEDLFKLDF
jgi:tetratricopeptide (TPR) repeat protein